MGTASSIPAVPAFPTWRTITLGTFKSVEDLSAAFRSHDFKIGLEAAKVLKNTPLAETETKIELVLVSVADLGFTKGALQGAIYKRAKKLGLDLVPAEVGPQPRLAYRDQSEDDDWWPLIGMKPIVASPGELSMFYMGYGQDGGPDGYWRIFPVRFLGALHCSFTGKRGYAPKVRWVFTRPKHGSHGLSRFFRRVLWIGADHRGQRWLPRARWAFARRRHG